MNFIMDISSRCLTWQANLTLVNYKVCLFILALTLVITPVLPARVALIAPLLLTGVVAVVRYVLLALTLALLASLGRRPASRHATRGHIVTTRGRAVGASAQGFLASLGRRLLLCHC